jgi:hypothetical protein
MRRTRLPVLHAAHPGGASHPGRGHRCKYRFLHQAFRATDTLLRCRPALYVEVDDGALRSMGSSAAALFARLTDSGYRAFRVGQDGIHGPVGVVELNRALEREGYTDLLFRAVGSWETTP